MPLELAKNETVLHPAPYVEGEPHLLVVTNQRVIHFGDHGRQELPTRDIAFVARDDERRGALAGVLVALLAVPLLVVALWLLVARGGPTLTLQPSTPAAVDDDPSGAAPGEAAEPGGTSLPSLPSLPNVGGLPAGAAGKALPIGLFAVAAVLLAAGAVLGLRRTPLVVLRGGDRYVKIPTRTRGEQLQVLATIQAAREAIKSMPVPAEPAPAPAPPVDAGDPVKALQELAAARAAGTVGEDEFRSRREALIARVRARPSV